MSRSKRSVEPLELPEFCVDRNLGRAVPAHLIALGWRLHLIADVFPDDAQDIADEDWIRYGLEHQWVPLCKDGRIKGKEHERRPLLDHSAVLFYLDNQQLRIDEMVRRIHRAQPEIVRAVGRKGPAAYAIGELAIRRTWP
ncbi:toxin-antitoxin system, toxin component, PIN family protein [Streptomyces sp. NPDC021020]|uniref:PIN-like domain-containing protein n=1 Tax=Streptomyces sp. NPDC021020 TaxID=3365109 RepID=UPI00379F6E6F